MSTIIHKPWCDEHEPQADGKCVSIVLGTGTAGAWLVQGPADSEPFIGLDLTINVRLTIDQAVDLSNSIRELRGAAFGRPLQRWSATTL
jgi:hypothetical protein